MSHFIAPNSYQDDHDNAWIWTYLLVVVFIFLATVTYAAYDRYKNLDNYNLDSLMLTYTTPSHGTPLTNKDLHN